MAGILLMPASAAQPGVKAQVVGGTLAAVPARASVRLDLTGTDAMSLRRGREEFLIPYGRVNSIEYGQSVSRRYIEAVVISPLFLLAKARKHFVTLGFMDERGAQQAVVLRVAKGDLRAVLAGLEARTGRRVEYQDNEARKGGKG